MKIMNLLIDFKAESIVKRRKLKEGVFEEVIISNDFIKRFLQNRPLKSRVPRKLEIERIEGGNQVILEPWYELLQKQLEMRGYHPSLMSNMDETMLSCKDQRVRVIIPAERRSGIRRAHKDTEHITLIVTSFADGTIMKTGAILPLKNLPNSLESMANDFHWAGTSSGWITAEIFDEWVANSFIPEIIRRRERLENTNAPALLLIDGHSSRECPDTLKKLQDLNIDVITFTAHATHLCQPLDNGPFSIFKRTLSKLKRGIKGATTAERRPGLFEITKKALHITSYVETIRKSWAVTGIHPFLKDVVLSSDAVSERPVEEKENPKGGRINISGKLLTSDEMIQALRERDAKKAEKQTQKGTKKRGRPVGSKNKPKNQEKSQGEGVSK